MDIHENQAVLLKSLQDCIELFNLMFSEICPIISLPKSTDEGSPTSKYFEDATVSPFILSGLQKEHIKYMSGLLTKAQQMCAESKFLIQSNFNSEIHDRIVFLENKISEYESNAAKELQKVRVLQEYLVNEINRNENLEERIGELEEKLVSSEDEKRKYMNKVYSLTGMSADKALRIDDLIGKYVMKKFEEDRFFGRIVGYHYPYFQIIYEDDDKEEMDIKEVENCLWDGSVPAVKVTRIAQYIEQYATENGITIRLDDKVGLVKYFDENDSRRSRVREKAESGNHSSSTGKSAPSSSLTQEIVDLSADSHDLDATTSESNSHNGVVTTDVSAKDDGNDDCDSGSNLKENLAGLSPNVDVDNILQHDPSERSVEDKDIFETKKRTLSFDGLQNEVIHVPTKRSKADLDDETPEQESESVHDDVSPSATHQGNMNTNEVDINSGTGDDPEQNPMRDQFPYRV